MSIFRKSVKAKFNIDMGILILRIITGGLMLTHGFGKFMKVIEGDFRFADPFGLGPEISLVFAAFAEFICAIFVMFGFLTRLSTIPLIITMATAAFLVHGSDPIDVKEKALLYLGALILLFYTGGGRYSVDRMAFK